MSSIGLSAVFARGVCRAVGREFARDQIDLGNAKKWGGASPPQKIIGSAHQMVLLERSDSLNIRCKVPEFTGSYTLWNNSISTNRYSLKPKED